MKNKYLQKSVFSKFKRKDSRKIFRDLKQVLRRVNDFKHCNLIRKIAILNHFICQAVYASSAPKKFI